VNTVRRPIVEGTICLIVEYSGATVVQDVLARLDHFEDVSGIVSASGSLIKIGATGSCIPAKRPVRDPFSRNGTTSNAVVRFYNKRGTAEQWIKEGKQAVKMTRLSCHRFRSNEVRLWLSVIAYDLGNLWRRLVLPRVDGLAFAKPTFEACLLYA